MLRIPSVLTFPCAPSSFTDSAKLNPYFITIYIYNCSGASKCTLAGAACCSSGCLYRFLGRALHTPTNLILADVSLVLRISNGRKSRHCSIAWHVLSGCWGGLVPFLPAPRCPPVAPLRSLTRSIISSVIYEMRIIIFEILNRNWICWFGYATACGVPFVTASAGGAVAPLPFATMFPTSRDAIYTLLPSIFLIFKNIPLSILPKYHP